MPFMSIDYTSAILTFPESVFTMLHLRPILWSFCLLSALAASAVSNEVVRVSLLGRDTAGALVHAVDSEYQSQSTKIKVLLPSPLEDGKRYPALYVLPVEPLDQGRWGDSLAEVKKGDLANKYGLICVLPTFSALPWYAGHPTDAKGEEKGTLLILAGRGKGDITDIGEVGGDNGGDEHKSDGNQ
jgi:hypothetical protein